jgi:hypothetical protein
MLTVRIINKTFNEKQIISMNPVVIPRVGDKVNMGYAPAPTVKEVLWDYGEGTSSNTTVTVMVD